MNKGFSHFRDVYNFRTPAAKGRLCVLIYTATEGFLTYITGGIFYTAFLQSYNINITGAGILSFIPFLASLFVVFIPQALSHFPRRRLILGGCKFLYYFLNIIGLTVLPIIITDSTPRLFCMITVTFLSSLFNVIATAGYSAWHIRFQPEEVRAYHLMVTSFSSALVAGILSLSAGWLCDNLPSQFMIVLRIFAFCIGIINVLFLLIPPEVEYPTVHHPHFSDIISIPLKNKKFMRTVLISFSFQFSAQCWTSQFNYYLLETIGITQTFYNTIDLLYGLAFILCMKYWQKRIEKTSWFLTFATALLVAAPLQIVYGFVQPGAFELNIAFLSLMIPLYVPLMLIVRIPQHFVGVGHNVAFANFQYINMPVTNRECYASCYQLITNLGAMSGMIFGIIFVELTADISFTVFGYTYQSGTPLLTMICGVVQLMIIAYVFIFQKKLEPDEKDGERA